MRLILQAGHMAQKTKTHNNWSPRPTHSNLPRKSSGLEHLTPPFLSLFITSLYTDFYSFVLCSSLTSTSSLTCPSPLATIPSGVPWICTWHCYHAMVLGYNYPTLLFCFRLSIINLILSFLPPTLLMWVFSSVSLTHRLEFLQSQSVSVPSIQTLATNLLANTILLRHLHHPHSSLCILHFGATGFLLDL
jgi:hypothetical protein